MRRSKWKINTAFVERLNLDIRQRVAATGRRVNTLCQGEDGVQHQLTLFQAYHNFVLPHASLRQPLLVPEADQWQWLNQAVAAVYASHGGWIDRPRVDTARSPALSRATMATTSCGVKSGRV
jgi:hypothetical protein